MWRPKSRVKWLKEGDSNTKFFHVLANGRKRQNFIDDICFDSVRNSGLIPVRNRILNFSKNHFKKVLWQRPSIRNMELNRLSSLEVEQLESKLTMEEVSEALKSCDGNKALGPDGFNLNCIQSNWEALQGNFMNFIHEFHKNSSIIRKVNSTFIA
ncbi:hypothetical protein Dsin_012505 [Dipteronia sinensis]|uniref:Uncharacterized protein n=1 Tax=Dipteronia sinensis TaxID=43782 RepID=A0AAE0AJ19_9ROSI|nr:hypothetical protein Dsin_012505 [Dipteronia sinensis]